MSYTVKYNRSTNHIAGIEAKCTSEGNESGGVVATYAQNSCGVLTRGNLATGKTYATIQEAYDAARKHTRRICKNCAKAAMALIEAEQAALEAEVAESTDDTSDPIQDARTWVEGAEHQVGDEVYYIPSSSRKHPSYIPAGKVIVTRVVDHGEATAYAPRLSYVVQVVGIAEATQGAGPNELHAPGSVPADYRFWETYTNAICADCRQDVSYANSKIVREKIVRPVEVPTYYGMISHIERRVCAKH